MTVKLSAVVMARDDESNIEQCLKSIRWADEIILVVDMSGDRTVERAKRYATAIVEREFDVESSQAARGFAMASGEWLLYLYGNERVSEELREEILKEVRSGGSMNGYAIPRKVWALGDWVSHGEQRPDQALRLLRRGKYHWGNQDGFTVEGEKGELSGFLHQYSFETIEDYITGINGRTTLRVADMVLRREPLKVRWLKVLWNLPSHFLKNYLGKGGYKDGFPGLALAALGALHTLALYAKMWENDMRSSERDRKTSPMAHAGRQHFDARQP